MEKIYFMDGPLAGQTKEVPQVEKMIHHISPFYGFRLLGSNNKPLNTEPRKSYIKWTYIQSTQMANHFFFLGSQYI